MIEGFCRRMLLSNRSIPKVHWQIMSEIELFPIAGFFSTFFQTPQITYFQLVFSAPMIDWSFLRFICQCTRKITTRQFLKWFSGVSSASDLRQRFPLIWSIAARKKKRIAIVHTRQNSLKREGLRSDGRGRGHGSRPPKPHGRFYIHVCKRVIFSLLVWPLLKPSFPIRFFFEIQNYDFWRDTYQNYSKSMQNCK